MASQVWLVTGCSSGFGAAFARAILARGDRVIATARNLASIKLLEETGAACLQLDISVSLEELQGKAKQAEAIYGRVDILVNNAGYAQLGAVEEISHETLLKQFNTNFFGTINLTQAFLPFFRARESGTIVIISSVDGCVGRPGFSPYTASKHALEGFAACLRPEIEPFGIRTLIIEPGTFRTSALTPNTLRIKPATLNAYVDLHKSLIEIYDFHGSEPGDPDKMAERMIDVVKDQGAAVGKAFPARLPFGKDAFDEIKEECENTLKTLEEWRDVICSTDVDQ